MLKTFMWEELQKQADLRTLQSLLSEISEEEASLLARLDMVKYEKNNLKRKRDELQGIEDANNVQTSNVEPSNANPPSSTSKVNPEDPHALTKEKKMRGSVVNPELPASEVS